MNTQMLQKCVEELKKPEPKLDYVVGVLETLIETNSSLSNVYTTPGSGTITIPPYVSVSGAGSNGAGFSGTKIVEVKHEVDPPPPPAANIGPVAM